MTWEIIAGIIALGGFGVTIGKIISNNTKALTEVKAAIEHLKESSDETRAEIKKIKDGINVHETRITVLEHDKEA